jgi:hypothetical protein
LLSCNYRSAGFNIERDMPCQGRGKDVFDKSMYTGELPQGGRMVRQNPSCQLLVNDPASGRDSYRSGTNVYKFAGPN